MNFDRFSRQIILPEVGLSGQVQISQSQITIIGAGGLGCPAAFYLAAAGIGRIKIIDFDLIEASNLNRQIAFGVDDIGKFKAETLAKLLSLKYNDIQIEFLCEKIKPENVSSIFKGSDFVMDCTDNFDARYLINDYCREYKIPSIIGSLFRFEGQICTFNRSIDNNFLEGKCYRTIFPEKPEKDEVPNCSETGIIGTIAGNLGTVMAWEYLKMVLNMKEKLDCNLIYVDSLNHRTSIINI